MTPAYLFSGDRNWKDSYIIDLLCCGLALWQKLHHEKVLVVHGSAKGADSLAEQAAGLVGLKTKPTPAQWDEYGRAAGPVRNQQMLDENDVKAVFCFHDDLLSSKGTRDMAHRALHRGIVTYQIKRLTKEELCPSSICRLSPKRLSRIPKRTRKPSKARSPIRTSMRRN